MHKKFVPLLFIVAIFCLLPAINGPLQLDDSIHLGPIFNWLGSGAGIADLVFGNNSGPFGRPVSILSFALNAISTGTDIWPMKLTNLLLHLLTGICLAKLFIRLFKRDANLVDHASVAGMSAAALWLILPQHISTIFYVIQRMTILASLFAVLACWLYVIARERIETNQKHGYLLLLPVMMLAVLSALSKETGLLVPLYCLLIECIYFRPESDKPRPGFIAWGFRLGVIYPGLLAAAYLSFHPGAVLDGYVDRAFTMPERVMTQVSVLADYFASTFLPMARSAGLYNDDFPITQHFSLQQAAILLLAAGLVVAAIRSRNSFRSFSAGIGLFLIGHLLESTIFSLEIYFAHRNYLPSMGLMLAAFGLTGGALHCYPDATTSFKRVLPIAFTGLFLIYCLASYGRAKLWSDQGALFMHAQIHHPASLRLRSELLLNALYAKQWDAALQQTDMAMQTAPADEKRTVVLWRILTYCYARSAIPKQELDALHKLPAYRITLATGTALAYVSAAAEANSCPGLDRKQLGVLASQWAVNTIQPPDSQWVWKTRMASARLLASSGDLNAGLAQAELAFTDSAHDFNAGVLAYQLANSLDDRARAQHTMSKLVASRFKYTETQQAQLETLRNP